MVQCDAFSLGGTLPDPAELPAPDPA
jgi:hypothetical protein